MLQKNPAAHCKSEVQPPWHCVPLHGTDGPHGIGVCDEHVPPWQVAAGISDAFGGTPEHDGGDPHCDPFVAGVLHTPPTQVSSVHGLPSTLQFEPLARAV